jgi:hypothetical protein
MNDVTAASDDHDDDDEIVFGVDICKKNVQKYRVFQKEIHNCESLYKFIQRACIKF